VGFDRIAKYRDLLEAEVVREFPGPLVIHKLVRRLPSGEHFSVLGTKLAVGVDDKAKDGYGRGRHCGNGELMRPSLAGMELAIEPRSRTHLQRSASDQGRRLRGSSSRKLLLSRAVSI
jgi:hypothetical protein